ncbi:YnfU family zinc-binding protein [Rahnella ecdela]|uniref:YnfU family zinc-binding protein n=1 Tax=Rahnella ecdela TaxID=2816250 RepID=UPI0030840910
MARFPRMSSHCFHRFCVRMPTPAHEVPPMSFFDGLKFLTSTTTKVTCPECGYVSEQMTAKVRKNSTLVCKKCGALFQPKSR